MKMNDCPVSHHNKAVFINASQGKYGSDGYLTKAQIARAEKAHNASVQKKMRQLWCLPKVQFASDFYNEENNSLDVNNWLTHYEQGEDDEEACDY